MAAVPGSWANQPWLVSWAAKPWIPALAIFVLAGVSYLLFVLISAASRRTGFARHGFYQAGTREGATGFNTAPSGADRQAPRVAPSDIFTPTRPRAGRRTLVGRRDELARILQALNDEASHVVLYSERGRGKTSLANLAVERLRRSGVIVGRHACDAAADFDQIIRGLLRDLPPSLLPLDDGATTEQAAQGDGCEAILPRRALLPADIATIPARLACPRVVFVVDEFDRVLDSATRTRLADTIKLLSDRGEKLLFMIVGVSTTLEHILGQHPSIERNIAALHLPLLQDDEIADMLIRGGEAAGVVFSDDACATVAGVARGMPYMAQLMGLRMTQLAVSCDATEISSGEIAAAVDRLLADAASDVTGRYAELTQGAAGAAMAVALYEAAAAPQDRWGRVTLAQDQAETLVAAGVLVPAPGVPGRFQPSERRLMYHVLLLAARDGAPLHASAPQYQSETNIAARLEPALHAAAAGGG
jgi:hypothetical protein